MKVAVKVNDAKEAEAVRTAWEDPAIKAFVIVAGTLMGLPSDRARARTLKYVTDLLAEQNEDRLLD